MRDSLQKPRLPCVGRNLLLPVIRPGLISWDQGCLTAGQLFPHFIERAAEAQSRVSHLGQSRDTEARTGMGLSVFGVFPWHARR